MRIFSEIKLLTYPLFVLPLALVSGPFLPDAILSFVSIYFILFLLVNKNFKYLFNDLSKIFLIFYVFLVLRSIFSEEIFFSLKNTLFYFRFLIFALLLKFLIRENSNFKYLFINILIIVMTVVSIDALIEYFRGSHWLFDKTSYPEHHNNRISGLFDEEYILGGFILSLYPSLLIIFYSQNKHKKFILLIISTLLILFTLTVLISGERSSLVKLLLLIFLIIFFTALIKTLRKKIIILFSILIIVVITITSQPKLYERLIFHTVDLLLQKKFDDKIDRNLSIYKNLKKELNEGNIKFTYFSKEHTNHAIISVKMFKDNIFFGHGVKMFRYKCSDAKYYIDERSCTTHSHGIVLSFISELGLIGLFFLFIVYYYLINKILKMKNNKNINNFLLISIFIYLFPLLPSGYFFNNYFSIILYILVGLHLGYKKKFR